MAGFLSQLCGRVKGADGHPIETDEVFPFHYQDHWVGGMGFILSMTFRCNDVLDPEKLRSSLVQLLKLDGWRKLGGRLRRDKNGKPEIHVPKAFTTERPAVRFSNTQVDTPVENHPLGCRLSPKSDGSPTVHEGFDVFHPFSVPDDFKPSVKHYFTTDEPLISLHITSFTNATLVSITMPHIVMDAKGISVLVSAWSNVLAGQPDRVPTFLGAKDDVLETVGTPSDEKAQTSYPLEDKQLKGLSLLTWGLRMGWDMLTTSSHSRTILLPAGYVSHLRLRAQEQLGPAPDPNNPHFLSDGDLILAWFAHMVASSNSKKKPAILLNAFDMRGRFSDSITSEGSYLQNLVAFSYSFVPATELSSPTSFGQMALKVRQSVIQNTTDMQVRSLTRLMRASYDSTGLPPSFGTSDTMQIACSNWARARLLEAVDFGPAVISGGGGGSTTTSDDEKSAPAAPAAAAAKPGACVSYGGSVLNKNYINRNCFINYGKGRDGDYRIQAFMNEETLGLIQEEFGKYRREVEKGGAT